MTFVPGTNYHVFIYSKYGLYMIILVLVLVRSFYALPSNNYDHLVLILETGNRGLECKTRTSDKDVPGNTYQVRSYYNCSCAM